MTAQGLTETDRKNLEKELVRRRRLGHTARALEIEKLLKDSPKTKAPQAPKVIDPKPQKDSEVKPVLKPVAEKKAKVVEKKFNPFQCVYCANLGKASYYDMPIRYEGDHCTAFNTKIIEIAKRTQYSRVVTFSTAVSSYTDTRWVRDCELFVDKIIPGIRIDCYLSLAASYMKFYKNAHFEFIVRQAVPNTVYGNHLLSPSWNLLKRAKDTNMPFAEYSKFFIEEINQNYGAKKKLQELKQLAKTKTVFLVCFEKDPNVCHRSLVKQMIESMEDRAN